jgi:hypothetical protein
LNPGVLRTSWRTVEYIDVIIYTSIGQRFYLLYIATFPFLIQFIQSSMSSSIMIVLLLLLLLLQLPRATLGFAAAAGGGGGGSNGGGLGRGDHRHDDGDNSNNKAELSTLFDRFRPTCPASGGDVRRFHPDLIPRDAGADGGDGAPIWAAVYRTTNNQPSVLVRDEFLQAMRSATGAIHPPSGTTDGNNSPLMIVSSQSAGESSSPVAVARLRKGDDDRDGQEQQESYILDSMRCILKKEDMDSGCDGGSEYTEAIATAIDSLLLYYLTSASSKSPNERASFEGVIRTKATLMSSKILEERGFREVQELHRDMATHVSSLDDCLACYATRSVSHALSPGARQRAVAIVSHLGRIDRTADHAQAQKTINARNSANQRNDDDYDPWAGIKKFI